MPRKPRMYMAGIPCHVIQRGNNRNACFYREDDYLFYLDCLSDACQRYGVACHAYVLMTNHSHLLLSPKDELGISKVVQSIGRRYVQYVNNVYLRSGTLWEGRHKSSLVDADNYLLCCYRYIELNPVTARMVEDPADYQWSSYRANANGELNPLITPHSLYTALGTSVDSRLAAYRALFEETISPSLLHQIRNTISFSMPLGDESFRLQIESALNRSIGQAKRGRPKK